MWQLDAKAGAWRVENPSEALYDVMVEADSASRSSVSVHIGWNDDEKRARRDVDELTGERALYGSLLGVGDGQNKFTLSYVDATDWSEPSHAAARRCFLLPYVVTYFVFLSLTTVSAVL